MALLNTIIERAKVAGLSLYQREPARVNGAVVALVLAGAAALGLAVSAPAVVAVVAFIAPLVVAELTRPKVVPVAKIEVAEEVAPLVNA
jgi:hypothetical protein